ncbi:chemotaxis protein CheW [Lysobacter panacisoli]|uniref:Chemotaxis protein CheW n=1 Tax=Lysobacter panacisoli TaxID=1255263 RepID=A0ABP9LHN9_9GAMM|nr:chemotaxis protein CheW [Lysobacter panacisoli]
MNHPVIDAYLEELLDLPVEPLAHAPVAANAIAIETAVEAAIETTIEPHIEAANEVSEEANAAVAPTSPLAGEGSVAAFDNLLAELDSDPLFVQAETMSGETVESSPALSIDLDGLLAELDADPLFVQAEAMTEEVANPAPAPAIDLDGLLAELDSDPLFAQAAAAEAQATQAAPAPRIEAPAAAAQMPRPTPPARPAHAPTGLRPMDLTPPSLPPSVTATHRWLRVAVGEDSYALELLRVQEVGRTSPIVAMRGAVPSVLGAMNLRGRIVPVFDLGMWLGTGRVVPDERARIVVVERDNELIGALVSAVDDVVTLGPDRIEPPLMASPSRAIVGVARVVAKPTVLLDANALFG